MSNLWDKYHDEMIALKFNYDILKRIDPNNEHLELMVFNEEDVSIHPEFWIKYSPRDKKTSLCILREANKQLKKAIRESEIEVKIKKLIPEFD